MKEIKINFQGKVPQGFSIVKGALAAPLAGETGARSRQLAADTARRRHVRVRSWL